MTSPIIEPVDPQGVAASAIIRAYMDDIVSRWHGRPATATEIDSALVDEPADDLRDPHGYLAIARVCDEVVGVGGLRFQGTGIAALTKVFTVPQHRGTGVGSALLDHLENIARDAGCSTVRLDTRSDLHEACRMYESRGYRRVAAFDEVPYSDRWYQLTF